MPDQVLKTIALAGSIGCLPYRVTSGRPVPLKGPESQMQLASTHCPLGGHGLAAAVAAVRAHIICMHCMQLADQSKQHCMLCNHPSSISPRPAGGPSARVTQRSARVHACSIQCALLLLRAGVSVHCLSADACMPLQQPLLVLYSCCMHAPVQALRAYCMRICVRSDRRVCAHMQSRFGSYKPVQFVRGSLGIRM